MKSLSLPRYWKPFRHWGRNCMFKPTCRCGTMLLSSMALLQLKRELFHKVIGVAGIGPKLGVGILSSIRPREFIRAVQLQDLKTLTTVPGIGKKTGERILLELKDKFTDLDWEQGVEEDLPIVSGSIFEDAVEALQALGFHGSEAERMVNLAKPHLTENYNLQELLKVALAQNRQQRSERTWRRNG